ncbi:MAG: alpha/beta hydrolase [Fusobacteria bacterium]|nr:alpha/beta hydrolase [Fusobacteriota bacterium]
MEKTVQVGDIQVGYRISGEGYPLVMIMGYGCTMNLWEERFISTLASQFKVIVFDNRGMGSSTMGTKAFSIEQFSEDTALFMEAIGLEKAHILGWSMGSMIAQELALNYPSKVNKLIIHAGHCGASLFPPAPEVLAQLTDSSGTPEERGMRAIGILFPHSWLETNGQRLGGIFFRPMGNISEESTQLQGMAIYTWQGAADRLSSLRNPTLVITGIEDIVVPVQNAHFMNEKLPYAQLELIEKGGHGVMFQYPELFCEKVLDFLK